MKRNSKRPLKKVLKGIYTNNTTIFKLTKHNNPQKFFNFWGHFFKTLQINMTL